MIQKIERAGAALDEVVEAYADIFGEHRANDWFGMVRDVLLEQAKNAGMIESTEVEVVDKEAEYKRMQDEAAAELERIAAAKLGIKAEVKAEEEESEEEESEEEELETEELETEEEESESEEELEIEEESETEEETPVEVVDAPSEVVETPAEVVDAPKDVQASKEATPKGKKK